MPPIKTAARKIGTSITLWAIAGCPSSSERPTSDASPPGPAAAAPPAAWDPPARPGCARSGLLEAIETDPACIVTKADEHMNRDAMRALAIELHPDATEIASGATVLVRLTLANRGAREVDVVFVAHSSLAAPRPDWTRLAGVPELRSTPAEGYRLMMPLRTLDEHGRSVDGLPTTPQAPGSARLLQVRVRPGSKLTHTYSWWALRIPAPMPIFHNDAGHRIVPKTAPVPLPTGHYTIAVDLPLYGVTAAEATFTTLVNVVKVEPSKLPPAPSTP